FSEIAGIERGTMRLGKSGDPFGDRTPIKRLAIRRSDKLKAVRNSGTFENLSSPGRAPPRHKMGSKSRLTCMNGAFLLPKRSEFWAHEKAVTGIADRRLGEHWQRQGSEALRERGPCGNRARHCHRLPSALRHRRMALETLTPPRRGRPS